MYNQRKKAYMYTCTQKNIYCVNITHAYDS